MMDNVNFKANYIKPVVIQHLEKGVYKPLKRVLWNMMLKILMI